MQDLVGRTAVVTGGGSGIGRGIALGMAAESLGIGELDLNRDAAVDLRFELAREEIGVSVLCPGVVQSELYRTSAAQRPGRFGGPEVLTRPSVDARGE